MNEAVTTLEMIQFPAVLTIKFDYIDIELQPDFIYSTDITSVKYDLVEKFLTLKVSDPDNFEILDLVAKLKNNACDIELSSIKEDGPIGSNMLFISAPQYSLIQ